MAAHHEHDTSADERRDIHVLWMTVGLGCDGESVAMTAARHPEDRRRADRPSRDQSVVDIARGLGKETIAEHIGDAATVELLRRLGVRHGQGFRFGMPCPLDDFLAELHGRPQALA